MFVVLMAHEGLRVEGDVEDTMVHLCFRVRSTDVWVLGVQWGPCNKDPTI